jgi:NitT/TauT family transport system substrate-binding protein
MDYSDIDILKTWKGTFALIGLVLIIGALFFVYIDSFTGNTVSGTIPEKRHIRLSINQFPNSALIFIAEEKGYFAEEGLEIEYIGFPTGKLALDALIGGGSDIATTADVPIALAGLADQDISAIATIEYSTDNIQVITRKDSGIATEKDLKGKSLATTSGGGPLFFTHKFLERHDIAITDVNLVFLNPSDMVTALIRKDIDAFIVFEPSPFFARQEIGPDNLMIFSPDDLYGETWNIVVMKDFERNDPEAVKSFLKALIKAELFFREHNEESLSIISAYSDTELHIVREMMKRQIVGVVLNELLMDSLNDEASWAMEQEFTASTEAPDYGLIVNAAFLQELKPDSVSI